MPSSAPLIAAPPVGQLAKLLEQARAMSASQPGDVDLRLAIIRAQNLLDRVQAGRRLDAPLASAKVIPLRLVRDDDAPETKVVSMATLRKHGIAESAPKKRCCGRKAKEARVILSGPGASAPDSPRCTPILPVWKHAAPHNPVDYPVPLVHCWACGHVMRPAPGKRLCGVCAGPAPEKGAKPWRRGLRVLDNGGNVSSSIGALGQLPSEEEIEQARKEYEELEKQ